MAEVRKAQPTTTQSTGKDAGKGAGKGVSNDAGKPKAAPKQKQPTGIAAIRTELAKVRRDHKMQQLDSPTKLRDLRKSLARELTKERAAQLTREANG
ncbi:MAG: uL29 family ribosomal protein [bacterium]|nr:uL29 family ribosomal protein [bacterium]MDZ4247853.1 uL29 family ribosomal protein [Patescibacteria group bacterium]